jgi:hypothetical protein
MRERLRTRTKATSIRILADAGARQPGCRFSRSTSRIYCESGSQAPALQRAEKEEEVGS